MFLTSMETVLPTLRISQVDSGVDLGIISPSPAISSFCAQGSHLYNSQIKGGFGIAGKDKASPTPQGGIGLALQRELNLARLEDVLQAKLEDAPRDRTRGDLSKAGSAEAVAGFVELCVIEKVEELRPELKVGVFPQSSDLRILDDRRIEVELRAAPHNSNTGVAEARPAPDELRIGSRAGARVRAVS